MFPTKLGLLRETAYTLFNEVFEESEPSDDSIKIIDCIMANLPKCKDVFLEEPEKIEELED